MTKRYQHEIDKLKKKILHLTAMVEENLMAAVRSFTERNTDLAERVINIDDEVDQYEVEVEEDGLKILALYQPVAIDLRFIIAVLKINNDLERIGDLAVNIAKRTRALACLSTVEVPFDLQGMLEQTVRMVKRASDALVEMDVEIAREVLQTDDEVDDRHRQTYSIVQEKIREDPSLTDCYISLLSVSRNLERIADHATNIAEDVIYMVDGEIVRHRGELA
jgi:phosphate transport system protein